MLLKIIQFTALFFAWACFSCHAQVEIPLYTGKIPNSKKTPNREQKVSNDEVDSLVSRVSEPSLSVFLPIEGKGKDSRTAVIICPGGGYHTLLIKREGSDVARAFNKLGIAAFVVKYRLPDDETMEDKSIGPLQDVQQAIKTVRQQAREWNIDPHKIGVMGFSAGGHLAATAGIHYNFPLIDNSEKIDLRPDFMILINPVISFTDEIGHEGSRNYLLGHSPTMKQINFFSNEKHVTASTPPVFLTHANSDKVVSVENSITFYNALRHNNVPVEMHIYAKGEHGFLTAPPFEEWYGRCIYWMKSNDLFILDTH